MAKEVERILDRNIKKIYDEIITNRVSLMGRFVKIGKLLEKAKGKIIYTSKSIEKRLLTLFYEGIVDLVPGKGKYQLITEDGYKFAYLLWKEDLIENKAKRFGERNIKCQHKILERQPKRNRSWREMKFDDPNKRIIFMDIYKCVKCDKIIRVPMAQKKPIHIYKNKIKKRNKEEDK